MNKRAKNSQRRGFTLIELMVAMVIALIIIAGIYQIFTSQQRSYAIQGEIAKMQQHARAAEEVLNKTIQQAGGFQPQASGEVVMFGDAIIAASDNYIVMQFDDPYSTGGAGNITPDEVVAFVVTRDLTDDGINQILGTDNATAPQITYDINNDGSTEPGESEDFTIVRNLKFPGNANEDRLSLYMVTPVAGATPNYELVASDVDNLIFRYYDGDGQLIRNDLPYNLTEDQVKRIRTVEMELLLRTELPDAKYDPADADLVEIPAFSVGTYGSDGLEKEGTGTVDAFGDKAFILGKDSHPTEKNHRRRVYLTKITPRNLANKRCGTIVVTAIPNPALCPNPTTINAVVFNGMGVEVDALVNFTNNNPLATFTPSSGTTAGAAGLDSILSYTSTQTTVNITATAPQVECTDGSFEQAQGFTSVGFAPGPSIGLSITDIGPDFDTCPGTWDFTATSYDACGNEVAPPAGITFETIDNTTLPTGGTNTGLVVGTLTDGGVFSTSKNTFTMTPIDNPGAVAQDSLTDEVTIALHTDAALPASLTAGIQLGLFNPAAVGLIDAAPFNNAIATVDMKPWPPSQLITSDEFPDYTCGSDRLNVVKFGIADCLNYTITNIAGAQLNAEIAPAGTGIDAYTTGGLQWEDPGFTFLATEPGPGTVDDPLAPQLTPGGDNTFDLYHYVPLCLLDPKEYPNPGDSAGAQVYVSLDHTDMATTLGFTDQLSIERCLECQMEFSDDVVTPCKGTASVTITDCDMAGKPIRLKLTGGINPFWIDANGNKIISDPNDLSILEGPTVVMDADGSFTASFSTGDSRIGDFIQAEAYSLEVQTTTGDPRWTCLPASDEGVLVQNACMDLNVYNKTSKFGDQYLPDGQAVCAAALEELIVEMDYCAFTGDNLPQKVLLEVRFPDGGDGGTGTLFDYEWITLHAVDSGTQPVRFFRGSVLTDPSNGTRGTGNDGLLEFPKEVAAYLIVDPDVYESAACPPQSMRLTPPLPLCFPNAITSGGGASWNGNFKVHWGDVVVRGTLESPNAYIEKYPGSAAQFDGNSFAGKSSLTDRFVDVYVGHSVTDAKNTYPDGNILGFDPGSGPNEANVYQPLKGKNAGNYFANLTYDKITQMVVELSYEDMRSLALGHSLTSYWITAWEPGNKGEKVFTGVYNPKTGAFVDTLEEVLQEPATNDNYDGEFIFVDTWGQPLDTTYTKFTSPVEDDNTINSAAANDTLPTHSIGGNSFFTTGIIYIAGNFNYVGQGSARTINVETPPGADLDYDHNNTAKTYTEPELPIRPDPIALRDKFDVDLNINGAIYVDGYFSGGGAPKIYGALTGEHGYKGNGAPEVWYNYSLNESGVQNALCVECCEITASRSVVDIFPRGAGTPFQQLITISGATGTVSDITWRSQNESIATVTLLDPTDPMTVVVTGISEGNTMVWVVDKNNCTLGLPVRVSSTCVGVTIDPAILPLPGSGTPPFLAGVGVEKFTMIDVNSKLYDLGLWEWSTRPIGSDIISISNELLLEPTKIISAGTCGTVILEAIDKTEECTGIYQSIVTVSSTLETTISPEQTVFQVGDTVDIKATGGSGLLTWGALPSDAVSFSNTTGPDTTVTFLREVHVSIDVVDENNCASVAETFVVRCSAPNVLNNIVSTTLGTEEVPPLPNMYWRATVDDNDPAGGNTFDQVDRVEFSIDPVPTGFWPDAGTVDTTSEYCAFGGDDCSTSLGDISQWPSGPYTLTATAYVTDPDYSCNATGTTTESFGSGTIDIYINNCGYEHVDRFDVVDPVWGLSCVNSADPSCVGTSGLSTLGNSLYLNAEPALPGAVAFASINQPGPDNRNIESSDDYHAYVHIDGFTDSTATGSTDTSVGIAVVDELNTVGSSLFAILARRLTAGDDSVHVISYLFDKNLGGGLEPSLNAIKIAAPYYLGIRKSGNSLSAYASENLATLYDAASLIGTENIPGLSGVDHMGLFVSPPASGVSNETATGQFSDFRLDCTTP